MSEQPLADRLRPQQFDHYVGQEAVMGEQGIIRSLIAVAKRKSFFPSLIFWGPPGCGKTTLARLIAHELERPFHEFSAVNASVKDIERVIPQSTGNQLGLLSSPNPVVFIDEIHRFNKSQQDSLLPRVERGDLILLGATTENPSFSVIGPLLSRCRVVVLQSLDQAALATIIKRAAADLRVSLTEEAEQFLLQASGGDARVTLNVMEIAAHLAEEREQSRISLELVEQSLQRRQLSFDKSGEEFYNTISALHKSVRGSDPDAALYWLARMLEAGQDPLYIARRVIRMASEDIGLADPQALSIAVAAYQSASYLGVPECSLALAEAVAYLAKAPKTNQLYTAYLAAAADVAEFGNLPIPLHIRNAPTKLMKDLGYGKEYHYKHSPTGQKSAGEQYLPEELKDRHYLG